MKKILFIIWSFSYGGGSERVLASMIRELASREKWDISLLEIVHSDKAWEDIPDSVHVLEPITNEADSRIISRARRAVMNEIFAYAPSLCRFFMRDSETYDVVISFNYQKPSFLLKKNELAISWNHGSIDDLYQNKTKLKRQDKAYERADAIVSITERTKQSILTPFPHYANKAHVIHNGFDFDRIQVLVQEKPLMTLPKSSYVAVGRLDKNKNPIAVLDAFCSIKRIDSNASLFYLGEGPESANLEKAIQERELQGSVHLLGYVKNPYPLIKQATGIISMSYLEGFQTVLVEALYLGIPFVSSAAGAAELFSQEGAFGRVVTDPSEAGEAMHELIEDMSPERRQAMNCYAEQFSVARQIDELESLISDLGVEI